MPIPEEVREIASWGKAGLLGALGGVVGYLADVVHHKRTFSWLSYGIFVLTAFFVGQVLDSWLPAEMPGKGGVLMVAGTSAYPILITMQARVQALLERWGR